MKILLIGIVICLKAIVFSQNFAPIGSTWHYTENTYSDFTLKSFFKIESTKDSLFLGKNCRLLVKNDEYGCEQRPLQVLVYEEDSIVYFWDESFNEFQILYDLTKKKMNHGSLK